MTAKTYLQGLRRLDSVIRQKNQELSDLRACAGSVRSPDYSRERVDTSSGARAPFEGILQRTAELEAEITQELGRFVEEKHRILNQIQGLPNTASMEILYWRYVEFLTFEQIALKTHYSLRGIYCVHRRALREFEQQYLQA